MNQELLTIKPQEVWKNFRELTLIPRPSKHEEQIINYMKAWGEGLGLETFVDEIGNVIIKKPATQGMENRKGVILQSHLDMVPQKNSDKVHDFLNDPITTLIDGDWVKADDTTLGSDNGMGVAAIMGILESKTIKHGAIEALFTIDEETGMTGAFALKAGLLAGDILLNLDSEDEGELYIGCAGGIDTTVTLQYKQKPVPKHSIALKIAVTGLKGGHSGVDIPLQRGNANKIMFRLLQQAAKKLKIRIAQVEGGSLRNAIPREAFAVITLPSKKSELFAQIFKEFETIIQAELKDVEANLQISYEKTELPQTVMDKKTTAKFINGVIATPHGVERLSYAMPEVAETSTNLAIVNAKNGEIKICNLTRSFVDAAKDSLTAKIESVWELVGAKVVHSGTYPGWKPNFDSPILNTAKDVFAKRFGNVPEIKSIHAGLECGLFAATYPNWDMISFGPTIRFPHSPDEKVNIKTVERFWVFLVELLGNIPSK